TELRAVRDDGPAGPRTGPGDDATQELSLRGRGSGAADLTATAKLPVVPEDGRAVDETAVLPRIPAEDADRTAVLPRVGAEERPAERTRELPVVDPEQDQSAADRRPRPEWAEETPMDDLPSLTDTLLGSREEWARWDPTDRPGPGGAGDRGDSGGEGGQGDRSDQGGQGDGKGRGRRWGRRG
ncbi:hypothetical protein ACFU74_05180, partial [Kitasatospora sp. NPDC057500]